MDIDIKRVYEKAGERTGAACWLTACGRAA